MTFDGRKAQKVLDVRFDIPQLSLYLSRLFEKNHRIYMCDYRSEKSNRLKGKYHIHDRMENTVCVRERKERNICISYVTERKENRIS